MAENGMMRYLVCGILLFSFAARALEAPGSEVPLRVLIDPGHGGSDRGATRGDLRESQITLQIAQKLAILMKKDPRFNFSLSRSSDRFVSLPERVKMAHLFRADVLLSIHANSNTDSKTSGVEIYFQNQLPADEESMFLAAKENGELTDPRDLKASSDDEISEKGDLASILQDLRRSHSVRASFELSQKLIQGWPHALPRHNPVRLRQAPFYVVSRGEMPAVLVEVGFLTHALEGPKLKDPEQQNRIAKQIFAALSAFKESVDKDRSKNLKSSNAL